MTPVQASMSMTRRWTQVTGLLLGLCTLSSLAIADEPPPPPPPPTEPATVSPDILELAQNLLILEELDLLIAWDLLELMPLLEENDER